MRIALATCEQFPDLDDDERRILPALAALGAEGVPAVWTDASVPWDSFDAVVLRATWDYSDRRPEFLQWLRAIDPVTHVVNAVDLVTWNTDKTYLRDLAAAGVPTVPTQFLTPGADLVAWAPPQPDGDFVVKPAVSAGSRDTMRYAADGPLDAARQHVAALLAAGRTVMVQPYLDAVDDRGETALLYFDGGYSHAIRKGPLLRRDGDGNRVAGLFLEEDISPREATSAELAVARRVLAAVPGAHKPVYARVDLVPGPQGEPLLLELELTEPSLFLGYSDSAAEQLADAVVSSVIRNRRD